MKWNTIVDRLVIRGDDPRDPGWMKLRAVGVSIAPAVTTMILLESLNVPNPVITVVTIPLALFVAYSVGAVINERKQGVNG